MENLEAVMRRIAKLLAIAQDDRADPAEAAAAAGMAERIMRKYQLENSDILIAQLKAGDGMAIGDCVATAKTNGTKVIQTPLWAQQLAVNVAKLNELNVIMARSANGESVIRFRGFKSDVEVGRYTFDYLVATINRLCKAFRETDEYRYGGRSVANSYRLGVAHGIATSLSKEYKAKLAEQETSSTGRELVICKARAVAEHYGQTVTRSSKTSVRRGDSYSQGFTDGRQVNINQRGVGTSNNSTSQLRLGV